MEKELFYQINQQWTGEVADWIMATASSLSVWMVPLIIIFSAIALFGGFKGRVLIVVLALAIAVTDGLVVKSIKETVGRLRPSQIEGTRLVKLQKASPAILAVLKAPEIKTAKPKKPQTRGASFPSAHTANNFAVAAVLMLFFRRWGWLYLPMAVLVSYSRMYTGSHWPGDVLFSVFLGLGLGWAITRHCENLYRRHCPRVAPKLYRKYPSLLGVKETLSPDPVPAA